MSRSYATFDLARSWQQVRFAWQSRDRAFANMSALLEQLRRDEARMSTGLGRPIEGLRILEVGPGQGLERAQYFGLRNEVDALDLDVIPQGIDPMGYLRMLRYNGIGRVAKTIGRRLILGPANARAWRQVVAAGPMTSPRLLHGDICERAPEADAFDMVMSWSVFEHLPEPDRALVNIVEALRPGGLFFVSLHLFTSNNGHHDIRAFTGHEEDLPLWAHLRAGEEARVRPSAYLNRWRLAQWRELFNRCAPGAAEYLETGNNIEAYRRQLSGPLQHELVDYSHEELLTVDVIYCWKKPAVI